MIKQIPQRYLLRDATTAIWFNMALLLISLFITIAATIWISLRITKPRSNPHFIHNALQSIGTLALQHQVPQIYTLVTALSKLMRYSMYIEQNNVTMSTELEHVRTTIRLLVHWTQYGITQIEEASEWTASNCPETKIIAVSAHHDFHLVRHTMKHDGIDYILKPIDPDAVNEAIHRAVTAWRQEDEDRHMHHI